jgi:PhnB protein
MSADTTGVPEGASKIIPRLFCRDPVAEIEFCTAAFAAVELARRPDAHGNVAHAMMLIGNAMVMIESEWPGLANRAPAADGSSPVVLYVYVENADETVNRALEAGARVVMPLTDQFWGDRTAWIVDPSGHVWTVATRIEETTEEERQERLDRIHAKSTPGNAITRTSAPRADRRARRGGLENSSRLLQPQSAPPRQ